MRDALRALTLLAGETSMNKLIEELFKRACFETEYDDVQNLKEMSQRFAELIILECAKIVATAVEHREPASTYVSKILELSDETSKAD